jgi:hypothetical protein
MERPHGARLANPWLTGLLELDPGAKWLHATEVGEGPTMRVRVPLCQLFWKQRISRPVVFGAKMDALITLRKVETCQVLVRNVPENHARPMQEWIGLALTALGKDWEEARITASCLEYVDPGMDGLPEVEFRPIESAG